LADLARANTPVVVEASAVAFNEVMSDLLSLLQAEGNQEKLNEVKLLINQLIQNIYQCK